MKLPGIVGASGGYSNTRSQPRSTALGGYSKPRNQMGSGKLSTGGQSDAGSPSGGGGEAAKVKRLQDQIEIAEEELAILRKARGEQLLAQNVSRQCKYKVH